MEKPTVTPNQEPSEQEIVSEETLHALTNFTASGLSYSVREGHISEELAATMFNSWFPSAKHELASLYQRLYDQRPYRFDGSE